MTPVQKHFAGFAAGFVTAIERGWMTREECQVILSSAAFHPTGKYVAGLTPEQRDDLATWACIALDDAISRPGLSAQNDIRVTVGPMLSARKPRNELRIAAYRAANGRLTARIVEEIVEEEIAAFLTRLRGIGSRSHAG